MIRILRITRNRIITLRQLRKHTLTNWQHNARSIIRNTIQQTRRVIKNIILQTAEIVSVFLVREVGVFDGLLQGGAGEGLEFVFANEIVFAGVWGARGEAIHLAFGIGGAVSAVFVVGPLAITSCFVSSDADCVLTLDIAVSTC